MRVIRPRFDHLTREQEQHLARQWRNEHNVEAFNRLVTSHFGLAIAEAQRWWHANKNLAIEDLVQEGCIGLTIAAQKFDPKRNIRFYTYAISWVKAMISRFVVRNVTAVKITTANQRKTFYHFNDVRNVLIDRGQTPSLQDLANCLGVKLTDVQLIAAHMGRANKVIDDEFRDTCDSPETMVLDLVERQHLERNVAGAIARLTAREQYIVRQRFFTDQPWTLKALGKHYKLTRERIRQIQNVALTKLKDMLNTTGVN
jgi:RNA polymerase sigma-32 factor